MKIKVSIPQLMRSVFGLFLVISLLCGFLVCSTMAQQFKVWNPPPIQAPGYVQGEIVVKFKSGVVSDAIERFNQEKVEIRHVLQHGNEGSIIRDILEDEHQRAIRAENIAARFFRDRLGLRPQ